MPSDPLDSSRALNVSHTIEGVAFFRYSWLALLFFLTPALAQEALYRLPDTLVSQRDGVVTLSWGGETFSYVEGLGWTPPLDGSGPVVTADGVYAPASFFETLDMVAARVEDVRLAGDSTLRAVVDFSEGVTLSVPEQEGRLEQDQILNLQLPPVLLPRTLPDPAGGVALELFEDASGVTLSVSGPPLNYKVFTLTDPTRLVLDLTPLSFAEVTPETRAVAEGVTYRRFAAPTTVGSSGVHVLEVAPNRGEFRVVGANQQAQPVSELASGSLAAINAGYFDRSSLNAIGLLKVGGGLLSLPSRGRSSIGFSGGGVLMDRLNAEVSLQASGRRFAARNFDFEVVTSAGTFAGTPRQGVIVVEGGRVKLNKVGPRVVPEGGFAIIYAPEERELALINEGEFAALDVRFNPSQFASLPYAVEAGPLLLKGGVPAFEPELEQFRRGERILDHYTQQAAIGLRPDGTVLLVAADNMIAEDLIPLFVSLGASDAMRLDSGGSTTLYADGEVLNRLREREVVSAIVYVPY